MKAAAILLLMPAVAAVPATARDKSFPEEESRRVLQDYAKCVVKKNPELIGRYVRYEYSIPMPYKWRNAEQIMRPDCLRSAGFVARLSMRDIMFRGALAEQLLKQGGEPIPPLSATNLISLSLPTVGEFNPVTKSHGPLTGKKLEDAKIRYARSVLDNFVLQLGQCVTLAAPDKVQMVLETAIDEPEEMNAMRTLSSEIAGCVTKGETLKFNRTNLRAAMAISYYRFSTTPSQARPVALHGKEATNA